MNPIPSTSSSSSAPRITLPEAPPSYYDFPPSYTAKNDTTTDELPAYCPREIPTSEQPRVPPQAQQIYTVLPRQAYAIRLHRSEFG
uniref:Uncharacterized protein n=1 Tax=Caenorhabditis japonica TaxID=281687 RepID=A0A8R1HWR9_CAEJA